MVLSPNFWQVSPIVTPFWHVSSTCSVTDVTFGDTICEMFLTFVLYLSLSVVTSFITCLYHVIITVVTFSNTVFATLLRYWLMLIVTERLRPRQFFFNCNFFTLAAVKKSEHLKSSKKLNFIVNFSTFVVKILTRQKFQKTRILSTSYYTYSKKTWKGKANVGLLK